MYHSYNSLLPTEAQEPESYVQILSQVEHSDGLHRLDITRTLAITILQSHFYLLIHAMPSPPI